MGNQSVTFAGTRARLRRAHLGVVVGALVTVGLTLMGIAPASALPMERGVPLTVTVLTDEVSLRACGTSGSSGMPYRWISYSAKGSNVTLTIQGGVYNGYRWTMLDTETLANRGPWFTGYTSRAKCRSDVLNMQSYSITKYKWVITASRPGYATTKAEITLPVR